MIVSLSLGAGVQSSALLLMSLHGETYDEQGHPVLPQHVVFADTGDEPKFGGPFRDIPDLARRHGLGVYGWLDYLRCETRRLAPQVQFHIVRRGDLSLSQRSLQVHRSKKTNKRYLKTLIPFYLENARGERSVLARKCTADFKVAPIERKLRELARPRIGEKRLLVEHWIGISLDEVHRMKPSKQPWIRHRWPLVEMGMTRAGCLAWMEKRGYPTPPRSACVQCPYHSPKEWQRLKTEQAEDFWRAVEYERSTQEMAELCEFLEGVPFLYRTCEPLDAVNFTGHADDALEGFGNECAGICGV